MPVNCRPTTLGAKIIKAAINDLNSSVVTTDFFGMDISDNHFKLKGLGAALRDGRRGTRFGRGKTVGPRVPSCRGGSLSATFRILKAEGTLQDQIRLADLIYVGFGRWSSVGSAIVCWGLIVGDQS